MKKKTKKLTLGKKTIANLDSNLNSTEKNKIAGGLKDPTGVTSGPCDSVQWNCCGPVPSAHNCAQLA